MFETQYAIDQFWIKLQQKNNFYTSDPIIGKQSNISSTIMEKI